MSTEATRPQSENGVLYLGPWDDLAKKLASLRWPFAKIAQVVPGLTRLDLSDSPRGVCPGFNDRDTLALLSQTGERRVAIGFFCDSIAGAEGVRVFEAGTERDRRRVEWRTANPPDPIAWPIAALAVSIKLPLETITRVARPARPALAVAIEALLNGGAPPNAELRHQALQLFGAMDHARVTAVLIEHLKSDDWVARFHAVKSYARKHRGPGKDGRPPLQSLLGDEDEGVRENALKGIAELLPEVTFSDKELHEQIDAAIARGLADADDDVKRTAAQVQELRKKLLG